MGNIFSLSQIIEKIINYDRLFGKKSKKNDSTSIVTPLYYTNPIPITPLIDNCSNSEDPKYEFQPTTSEIITPISSLYTNDCL